MAALYLPLFILLVLAVVTGIIAMSLGVILGPRRPSVRKSQTYESGMVPYGPGTQRISVRYYLIAMLFILFDIEMVFFLPWAVIFRQLGKSGLVGMLLFIGVLTVGYIYAWKKGALEWD
jgi:NADH-quinone oxidoreductase subunit A